MSGRGEELAYLPAGPEFTAKVEGYGRSSRACGGGRAANPTRRATATAWAWHKPSKRCASSSIAAGRQQAQPTLTAMDPGESGAGIGRCRADGGGGAARSGGHGVRARFVAYQWCANPELESHPSDAREHAGTDADLAPQSHRPARDAARCNRWPRLGGVGAAVRSAIHHPGAGRCPLEIEANISGREDGYVHVGDPAAIKFDTFPYFRYGYALGHVTRFPPTSSLTNQGQIDSQQQRRTSPGLSRRTMAPRRCSMSPSSRSTRN